MNIAAVVANSLPMACQDFPKISRNRTNHFLLLPLLLVLRALVATASPARSGRVRLACLLLLRLTPITKS